ncbi:hypothetical protein AB4K20DRAFT_1974178 [Rhizopus microsporus]
MKHTEQKSYFDGVNITRVPILRQNLKSTARESSENPPLKRPSLQKCGKGSEQHVSNRLALRNFYNSKNRVRLKRMCEMQNDRFRRRLCVKERTFLIGKKAGHALSCSTTKGFRRYGGKWKQCMHGMNVNVRITNENMTSQTCMYCFSKLVHSIHRKMINDKEIKKKVKGYFLCRNPDCVLMLNQKAETFPELSAKISHCNTDFINKTASFLNARKCWDIGLDANNQGKSKTFEKNGY